MYLLLSIIKISRPVNVLITFAVVYIAMLISAENGITAGLVLLAGLSAALVTAAGNIINDIFDIEIDKINRPDRVLPSGKLKLFTAKLLYLVFTGIAIILSGMISFIALVVVLITTSLLFIYSWKLKGVPLLGNFVIAVCAGLAFLFGGLAVDNWKAAIIPALFAFLINFIREILKDIEDFKGDYERNVNTFITVYGIQKGKNLISILVLVLILVTFYPFLNGLYKIEYFLLVLFSVNLILVYFLKVIISESFVEKISGLSFLLKISMIFGLLAIYLG